MQRLNETNDFMKLNHLFPILDWLPNYKKQWFKGDVVAGITTGVMLIPQGIAYAMIAGLPPIYGLYTALIPPLVYMLFGTSRQLAMGPVAMDSLIIASGISGLAVLGTDKFIALAILTTFMVGVIQWLFGVFKLGFLVNFLSRPVINGFTSGAAVIIALGQVKYLIGADIQGASRVHELLKAIYEALPFASIPTMVVGIATMLILMILKKYVKKLPGPLAVVILGILAVRILALDSFGIEIVGLIPEGLPGFSLPNFDYDTMRTLLPIALTLSIIGFMEAISIGKSLEQPDSEIKISANKELRAIGLNNMVGSFFQSFVSTSSFSRSAVNFKAGANTLLSTVFASGIVALTLLVLTPVFYYLPKTVIAAIIIVAVSGLFDYKTPVSLWKYNKSDALVTLVTFLMTIVFGIEEGILTGVLLSIGFMIYNATKPHVAVLGRLPNNNMYRNIERFDDAEVQDDILVIRFDSQLNFANSSYFKDTILSEVTKKGPDLKLVIIKAVSLNNLDSSGIHVIRDVMTYLENRGISLYFAGLIGPVRDRIFKSGFIDEIGAEKCFLYVQEAVDSYRDSNSENKNSNQKYTNQANL